MKAVIITVTLIMLTLSVVFILEMGCRPIKEGTKQEFKYVKKFKYNSFIILKLDSIVKDKLVLPSEQMYTFYFTTDSNNVTNIRVDGYNRSKVQINSYWKIWYDSLAKLGDDGKIPVLLVLKEK